MVTDLYTDFQNVVTGLQQIPTQVVELKFRTKTHYDSAEARPHVSNDASIVVVVDTKEDARKILDLLGTNRKNWYTCKYIVVNGGKYEVDIRGFEDL